jgi:tRNA dimethylallyltransferase
MQNAKLTKTKLIVILGPTASGKSEMAVKLAKKFNGEIISADSRQIYKGMNIGTGQITKKEMEGIPHYLINVVYPNQEFNVALFKKMAIKKIKIIQKKGKLPFLVGGTGLYISSIVNNIEFPEVPPQKKLRKELEKKDTKELFKIYKKIDAKGAKFIEKENKRRLIRAIEVCKSTGKSFWAGRKKSKPLFDTLEIGIKLPKEKLERKVSERVEKMLKIGLEKEVKKLIKKYNWNCPVLQTIGYQEWLACDKVMTNKKEVVDKIKTHTLQFAKRQITWFKRDKKINWIKNYLQAKKLINKFLKSNKN